MKNKKIKDGKGITLIVWIITIIVLLILVGITVMVLIDPNGILTNDLETNKQKGEIGTSGDGEVQTLIEMYKNGENCEILDCTDATHLHVGDYVEGYVPGNVNAEVEVGKDEDENEIVYNVDDPEKNNIDNIETLGAIYEYEEGDYVPENYVIDMAKKDGKSIVGITEKKVGDEIKGTAYAYNYYTNSQFKISQKAYDMLFKGTTEEENYSKSYWLASPGVVATSSAEYSPGVVLDHYIGSGFQMFDSYGEWSAFSFAVRPVIVLKSNVTRNQITKADNQNPPVDEWTNNDISYTDSGTLEGEEGQVKEDTIQEGGMLTLVPMTE